jgi:hypothetical protein
MSDYRLYTDTGLQKMNAGYPWSGTIVNALKVNNKDLYELHATGDADLNGRKYVALPMGTDIKNPEIVKKYNLM